MPIVLKNHNTAAPYNFTCEWPDDCQVQWGGAGIVIGRSGTTAFFEAFPADTDKAGGFIRGEGATVPQAEFDCFTRFTRQNSCDHIWGREKYDNGGMLCRRCRAFRTGLRPIVKLGDWRKPLTSLEDMMCNSWKEIEPTNKHGRRLALRKRIFGVVDA